MEGVVVILTILCRMSRQVVVLNIFFTAVETDYSLKQVDKDGGVRADERWEDLQRGRQVKVPGGTLTRNGRSILQTGLGDTFGS